CILPTKTRRTHRYVASNGATIAHMSINYESATSAQLKAEITAAGRSIRNIAEEMDVDYTTLYKLITGKRSIRLQTVYAILAVINVDPSVFFTRVQERAET